jgi:hypothetical protein
MSYELKYLKYKNKYINLKNMVGNGLTPEQKEAKKIADAKLVDSKNKLKLSKIDKTIQKMIIDKKIDADKAIELFSIMYEVEFKYFNTIIRENLDINLAFKLVNYLNSSLHAYKQRYPNSVYMSISILRNKLKLFGKPEQDPSFFKRLDFLMPLEIYVLERNLDIYFQYSDEKLEIIKKLTEIIKPNTQEFNELIKVIYYSDDKIINLLNKVDPPFNNNEILIVANNIINIMKLETKPHMLTYCLKQLNLILPHKYAHSLLLNNSRILNLYENLSIYLSIIDETFLKTLPNTVSIKSVKNNNIIFRQKVYNIYDHMTDIYIIFEKFGIAQYVIDANDINDIMDYFKLIYILEIYQDKQHEYNIEKSRYDNELSEIYQPLLIKLREVVKRILDKMLILHNITNETYRNEIINKSIYYAESVVDLFYNIYKRFKYFSVIRSGINTFVEKQEKILKKKIEGLPQETDDNMMYSLIMKD